MGFLDDVVGKVKEAAGGGLQGVIQTFKEKGLGDIVSSWVGTGQNLPISGDQLKTGLGADLIGQLASKVGVSPDVATSKLAEILPGLIDKLTPEGKVPESGLLQEGLNFLRSNFPKG